MKRLVPKSKMSKKARRALDGKKRVLWAFSPVTRRAESARRYRRSGPAERKRWEASEKDEA